MMGNIYLTGMMGCGKTTVGKLLARETGREFIDVDARVEKTAGMAVAEIFERDGEAAFRRMESAALAQAALQRDAVISCGGGIVLDARNVELMKKTGVVVYLQRDIHAIRRTLNTGTRPLLQRGADDLHSIFSERRALYEKSSDHIVRNDRRPVDAVREICKYI